MMCYGAWARGIRVQGPNPCIRGPTPVYATCIDQLMFFSGTNNHQVPMFVITKILQAGSFELRVFYKWSPRATIYLQTNFIDLYLLNKK